MIIVAAVDRSDHSKRVVDEAVDLSQAFDAPLHVVHVMTRSEFIERQREYTEENKAAIDMDTIRELAAEYAENAVTDSIDQYQSVGLVGDASTEVISYAEEHDARYIVTGGRKRSPTGKAIFGSTSQSILLNSRIPVVSIIQGKDR